MRGFSTADRKGERGQALVLFVLSAAVLFGMAALVIDVGLAYVERRHIQNAVDAAALAAADDLADGKSIFAAEASAYDYMKRHGITDVSDIQINIPPLDGKYAGQVGYVQVTGYHTVPMAFLGLFRADPWVMGASAVAEGRTTSTTSGGSGGDSGSGTYTPTPIHVPNMACGSPATDGRVTADDGYKKIADLGAGANDLGDVFAACDDSFYHFALVLNGPTTGGASANENVYGCKAPSKPPKPGTPPKPGECGSGDNPNYHTDYDTGWAQSPKGAHTFKDLANSDRARFQVICDGTPLHDFVQDYLRPDGAAWASDATSDGQTIVGAPAASSSSLEWNLEHPSQTGWGDNPGEKPLTQSPPFSPTYPTASSQYSGWVWEMIYEFKVPKANYASCGTVEFTLAAFTGQTGPVGGIHSSPPKTEGSGSVFLFESPIVRLVE